MPAHTFGASRFSQRQGGFAMIALIVLIAIMSSYLIANALSRTNAEMASSREQRSMNALRQAKAALIAYAASEEWQQYRSGPTNFQPGALPCPDSDDSGNSAGICSGAVNRIGRLPWKTLGIDDLRDASGERLWYALSANFRKLSGTTVINSDTQGQLTVIGTAPANNIVAIVFAPGEAIQGQNRDPANAVAHNSPANYLEGYNASYDTFTSTAFPSDTFNDRLVVITQADLMSVVEPVVAAMIERDIKPYINTYFTQWSRFPFPVQFNDPTIADPAVNPVSPNNVGPGTSGDRPQNFYVGSAAAGNSGLLPISASVTYPWTPGSGSITLIGGIGLVTAVSCNTVTSPVSGLQCSFTLLAVLGVISNPKFRMQGQIGANAGISFAKLPDASAVQSNVPLTLSPPPPIPIRGTLTGGGVGTVIYEATYPCAALCLSTITITIPDVTVSPIASASDPQAGWFIANQWYRQTYYAVAAPGYLPGGGAACPCLTVNNMPAYYALPNNNKKAILVLAGKTLNGSSRPSPNLADYLEGENSTPADFIYEHRSGVPTSINDRVVVVSP